VLWQLLQQVLRRQQRTEQENTFFETKNPLQIILFYRHEGRSPLAKLLTVLPLFAGYEILPTHEEGGRKSLGGGFRPQV
jgi:hypothetical protein